MARKFDLISELYERTCFAVTDNPVNWQSFLKTAGRNFRLRFDEQLLIYAQRPDATAVLEIERWNGTFGRWVNRGAKGIAVFEDADRSRQRLIHYFDISDTHESRYSRPVPIWEMRPEFEAEVIETLENTFGAVNDTTSIENVVKESIANAVEDNIADYISDFMSLGAGSDIEYLSADEASTFTASAKDAEPAKVEIDFSNVEERKIEFEVGGGKKNVMACYGSIICHLRRSDSSIGKVWY